MASCCKLFLFFTTIILVFEIYVVWKMFQIPPVPKIPTDTWWGRGNQPDKPDLSIREFTIKFEKEMIDNLQSKLNSSDYFTEPLEGIAFEYGFNNNYLKEVVTFWKNRYNFEKREIFLNQYPQFKTNIQGLDVHYIHVKPKKSENLKVIPLLLLHGWPGSVAEFYRIIPFLIVPRPGKNYIFELIIPSIPGFGYSQAPTKPGFDDIQITVLMKNMMERIGFEKFIIQGGDWGSAIGHNMAILFPENVIGYHTNFPIILNTAGILHYIAGIFYPGFLIDEKIPEHMSPLGNLIEFVLQESGYFHIQSTKPDTIGVALRDSPVGLAAYILEKFSTWTNKEYRTYRDGGLTKKYTMTELFDNIMIYWHSKSITTSMRIYKESITKSNYNLGLDHIPIEVPSAVSRNEHEMLFYSERQIRSKLLNLVQLTDNSDLGHFAAMEAPDVLSADIWDAAGKFLQFYEQKGKNTKSSEL